MHDKILRQIISDELDYEPRIDACDVGVAVEGGGVILLADPGESDDSSAEGH